MKYFLLFISFLCTLNTFSQKEANFWYFGEGAGLDFSTAPPTSLIDGKLKTREGCTTFSDANGNLLFYSDGITVWDKNHNIMTYTNGNPANDLRGNPSSTQSGIIIPKPGNSSIYYLFTVDNITSIPPKGLNYYTIDMSLNGGTGQLIDENSDTVFYTDLSGGKENDWTEKITGVRGKDCDVFWLISTVEDKFYSFKIDQSGVNTTPIISPVATTSLRRGYLKLSPDGTKLAIANGDNNSNGDASLYNFNNATGVVTDINTTLINDPILDGEPYGVEFSANSKKLYISTVSGVHPDYSYKLFQFDLTAPIIANSKSIIHQQDFGSINFPRGGYRGALQIGLDRKIYATIPYGYDIINDNTHLDVIENPDADATDIVFTKNAVELLHGTASQGLPAFISILLLNIEFENDLTSEDILEKSKFCIGDNTKIVPKDITGASTIYEWSFNNGTTTTILPATKSLELNNLTVNNNGIYTLKVELTDQCGKLTRYEGSFSITVFEAARAKVNPDPIILCNTDTSIDHYVEAAKNTEILDGLDPSIFEVLYFDELTKANDNVGGTDLSNTYNESTIGTQTIYARVHNINAPNTCFAITSFNIVTFLPPIPDQPTPYKICDNDDDGDNTNGEVSTFILNTKDTEIYGTLDSNQYIISYHTTPTGAETNDSSTIINKDTNHKVTNSQTVYIRVENKDNATCYNASSTLELIVSPIPVLLNTTVLIQQCTDNPNKNTTTNLTEAEKDISTDTNVTFEYYTSNADAIAGIVATQVADKEQYPVTNGAAEAWVRVFFNDTFCYNICKIEIEASYAANIPYNKSFEKCGDPLKEEGVATFDFSSAKQEIINTFPPAEQSNIDVFFYEKTTDRDANINEIPDISNHTNDNDASYKFDQTIYFKIKNNNNVNCEGIGELFLKVNPIPVFSVIEDPIICAQNIPYTLNAENPEDDYNYLWTEISGITISPNNTQSIQITEAGTYTVTASNKNDVNCATQKTIVVEKSNFGSSGGNNSINANPDPITFCNADTSIDHYVDLADLKNAEILNTLDSLTFAVLYFDDLTKANDKVDGTELPNPYKANTTGTQTIYARVHNINAPNGCFAIANFNIVALQPPTPNPPRPYIICDNDDDGEVSTFILNTKDTEIYGTLDSNQYIISYHTTPTGAETNDSSTIINKDTNHKVTNSQTVYIRVENKDNATCYNASSTLELIVSPIPVLLNTTVLIQQCTDNPNKNTTTNLTEAEKDISTDTNVTFEYYTSNTDAIAGIVATQVADKEQYPVTNGAAEAWVRVFFNDTFCYNICKIEIEASYAANVTYNKTFEKCEDPLDKVGITTFNFSSARQEIIDTFPTVVQNNIDVFFYEKTTDRDANINEILDISNHTNDNDEAYKFEQTIYFKIKNKNNVNCEGIGQLFLKISPKPNFSVTDAHIICDKNIPYTLNAENPEDDYNYLWTEISGITISPNNTQSIQITEAGTYTVTASNKNNVSCATQKTIVVEKSNFHTLNKNFVTIIDDTVGTNTNISIQIDMPINPLINDEFLYLLENENGELVRDYQESNIFNNLEGGIYIIWVENKNSCDTYKLLVSVIQFPKFFTPNGDGKNDLWTIKGTNNTFYSNSNSSINIFNRYGKIIAQLTIDNPGWDGTYNGKTLPSDDYWFNALLVPADTNNYQVLKKGHFSLLRK